MNARKKIEYNCAPHSHISTTSIQLPAVSQFPTLTWQLISTALTTTFTSPSDPQTDSNCDERRSVKGTENWQWTNSTSHQPQGKLQFPPPEKEPNSRDGRYLELSQH